MNKQRARLLLELEQIIGREFYNAKIQNWGPGGVWEGEGRELRYPISFTDAQGKVLKTRNPDINMRKEIALTGLYRLGQNELQIVRALDKVLSFLETHYDLKLNKQRPSTRHCRA